MTYQEILKSIDWPEQVLILDFETYYDQDYSLGKMSTIEYIVDERFDFTGVGFQVLPVDPLPIFFFKPQLETVIQGLQQKYGKNLGHVTVVAKNCKFDMTILSVKFGIIPPYIIDINDLLRHYDARMSHKLKDVAPMFGLKPKGDTSQFKGLHYEEMDNNIRADLANYCINDVRNERDLFKILLPKITNPIIEIPIARHTLDLYLQPHFKFNSKLAKSLRAEMALELQLIINKTGYTKEEISKNKSFVKILNKALPENESVPMKPGKRGNIPALAKDDVAFQELLVHSDLNVRNLCKARQAVKSWPLHVKRIVNMTNQANASGGLLRVPLHYYGGHTGRWSGGEKINLQNLGGRGRVGSGIHPLIKKMRSLLCTSDGNILGITDSSQIEARILGWLAGQEDLTKEFAEDKSPYCTLATELFGEKVWKPSEEEEKTPEGQIMAVRYGFGKDGILGCGYGMGADTFYKRCIANEDLRPLFDSGTYDYNFIKKLINTYRIKYSKIPEFWKSVEKAFKWVIKYPHERTRYGSYKTEPTMSGRDCFGHDFPLLGFYNKNGTVHLRLPSGRELTYSHCCLNKQGTIKWHYGSLWGGSITENIVQSVARDALSVWILQMEKTGLKVIMHNHDEIICVLPKNQAKEKLQRMVEIMSVELEWAKGLPLAAKKELSSCYKK